MAGKPLPTLTRAESEIMKVIWAQGSSTVHAVVEALPHESAYTTVLTLLRILEKKGYVQHAPDPEGGRAYVFSPAVEQSKVQRHHVRDLVDRIFSGRAQDLVANLVETDGLEREELERLRGLIDARLGGEARPEADARGAPGKKRVKRSRPR